MIEGDFDGAVDEYSTETQEVRVLFPQRDEYLHDL